MAPFDYGLDIRISQNPMWLSRNPTVLQHQIGTATSSSLVFSLSSVKMPAMDCPDYTVQANLIIPLLI